MMLHAVTLALMLAPSTATLKAPASAPTLQALTHVRVWSDGHDTADCTVLFRNGVITYVGQTPPEATGAVVHDGTGRVLTAGFVETRSFLGTVEIDQEGSTRDMDAGSAWATPAYAPADGFNPASEHIPLAREQGITHAVTGPSGHALAGLAHWVRLGAPATVERQKPAALWGSVDKGAALASGGTRGHLWMRLRGLLDDVHYFAANGPAWDRNASRPLALEPQHLRAISQTLREGTPWVLTANRAADIVQAVEFAQHEHIALVISGGGEAWQVAPLLARHDIPVIVTPTHQQPGSFDCLGARPDNATLLHAAGVRVILSTDLSVMSMPWLRQQAGIAVAHGLPLQTAVAAITRVPADVFKSAGPVSYTGRIAKDQPATMVLWSGDPFELSSHAQTVWVAGEPVAQTTRQSLLFQRYRRPPS